MKYLFGFGDSWAFGSELRDDEKNFVELLSKKLSINNFKNFAQPSTSIPHLIVQLRRAIEYAVDNQIQSSDVVAIFFLTSPHRELLWKDDSGLVEMHLNPTHVDVDVDDRLWYKNFHTTQLSTYRVNTSLVALQSICKMYGIEDRYIWGWDNIELWPEVDQRKIHNKMIIEYFVSQTTIETGDRLVNALAINQNPFIWPNSGHPNQLGHEKIAEILAHWIKI